MISEAKLNANRNNARLSTGPRTAEGKARSARNALKHGLSSNHFVVREDEQEEFNELKTNLKRQILPVGALEQSVFEQLLRAAWNLRRIARLEAELLDSGDPLADESLDRRMDRYARYQARYERSYYRALRELRTLQTDRILQVKVPHQITEILSGAASTKELLKRSQRFDMLNLDFASYDDVKADVEAQTAAEAPPPEEMAA